MFKSGRILRSPTRQLNNFVKLFIDILIHGPYLANVDMEIRFKGDDLQRIETDDPPLDKFSVAIIKSARRKLNFIRSAVDERDLRNWKSLHYEKLKGDRQGQRSVRLNDRWRLVFELNDEKSPPEAIVLEISDYH